MITYVIDASVYTPLLIVYGGGLVEKLRKVRFAILDLTVYEACNVFWKEHVKLHKISENEALIACDASKALSQYTTLYRITDLNVKEAMKIAVENNITFYDASYIALARKLKSPIASEDSDIIATAPKYGVEVIRLNQLLNILKRV